MPCQCSAFYAGCVTDMMRMQSLRWHGWPWQASQLLKSSSTKSTSSSRVSQYTLPRQMLGSQLRWVPDCACLYTSLFYFTADHHLYNVLSKAASDVLVKPCMACLLSLSVLRNFASRDHLCSAEVMARLCLAPHSHLAAAAMLAEVVAKPLHFWHAGARHRRPSIQGRGCRQW